MTGQFTDSLNYQGVSKRSCLNLWAGSLTPQLSSTFGLGVEYNGIAPSCNVLAQMVHCLFYEQPCQKLHGVRFGR